MQTLTKQWLWITMLDEFARFLDDNPFEEIPVDARTFVESKDFLGQPALSKIQYDIVESMAQIYKQEDVERIMGAVEGRKYYNKFTKTEIIMALGKGSGKDFTSTVGVAYVVYKLLCLKDPARYYGKPPGDAIDIINIAINAQQAKNVFFKGFKNKIERSPWFAGRYYSKMDSIEFDKAITVYSGHSERESHEGLNLFMSILDEISGFGENANNIELGKSGANIYKAFRGTVDSRFPDYGKVVLLSFTRYEGDFISKKYDESIAEKDVIERKHTFIVNPDLPEDYPDNTFTIEWEEDHITKYKVPHVFALKRPTWEVNPTRSIDDFKIAFYTDPADAKMRFLCQPTVSSDAFFRNKEKLQNAMSIRNPLDSSRRIEETWKPNPDKVYFVHADLAQRVDKCAVAVSHVERWVQVEVMNQYTQIVPLVVVDMIAWWEPSKHGPVNLSDVKNWIINLRRRGVDLGLVTFDRWNSFDIQQELREVGIRSETLSVGKKHYEDLAMLVYEDRVVLPHIELLLQELTELKVVNDKKVDHPRKGCFVGETRISLLDGTRPTIAELEGKEVWVYSAKEDGTIVPGKARGRFTKMVDELVDVVLDTGAVVRCTPDHLWMLRNGDYKEAKDLRPGIDRLMPINQVWPVNGGYERVTDKNGVKTLTHHMVVGAPPEGHVVHHKNHIKTDNRPENLEVISLEEHSRQHTTGRHDDEEYREALYAGLKKWNSLDSTKKKRSEYMKSRSKDWYKSKARSAKSFRSDITIDSLLSVADDNEATSANAAARILNCGRNVVVRVLKDHGYESWQELTEQTGNNHKVRHVTPVKLNSPVPVYDLEVDEWHNFALSSGVFVHNSKDLSDAMCGAVFNAISRTIRDIEPEIEIHTWAKGEDKQAIVEKEKPEVTEEVKEYLMNLGML